MKTLNNRVTMLETKTGNRYARMSDEELLEYGRAEVAGMRNQPGTLPNDLEECVTNLEMFLEDIDKQNENHSTPHQRA